MKKLRTILILILFPYVLVAQNDSLRQAQIDYLNRVRYFPYGEGVTGFSGTRKPLEIDTCLMSLAQLRIEKLANAGGIPPQNHIAHAGMDWVRMVYKKRTGETIEELDLGECLADGYEMDIFFNYDEYEGGYRNLHSQHLMDREHTKIGVGVVYVSEYYSYICVLLK